jgi:hypothetical protein
MSGLEFLSLAKLIIFLMLCIYAGSEEVVLSDFDMNQKIQSAMRKENEKNGKTNRS